jgi:hypothetical protein
MRTQHTGGDFDPTKTRRRRGANESVNANASGNSSESEIASENAARGIASDDRKTRVRRLAVAQFRDGGATATRAKRQSDERAGGSVAGGTDGGAVGDSTRVEAADTAHDAEPNASTTSAAAVATSAPGGERAAQARDADVDADGAEAAAAAADGGAGDSAHTSAAAAAGTVTRWQRSSADEAVIASEVDAATNAR